MFLARRPHNLGQQIYADVLSYVMSWQFLPPHLKPVYVLRGYLKKIEKFAYFVMLSGISTQKA